MKCSTEKLLDYIDGLCSTQEQKEMQHHLEGCDTCRESLNIFKITKEIFSEYYDKEGRRNCPSGDQLVSYQFKRLKTGDKVRVREHVEQCPYCLDELTLMQDAECELPDILEGNMIHSPLSNGFLEEIDKLKTNNVRNRMEKVLKSLISMGKEAITGDDIPALLDRFFVTSPDVSPSLSFTPDETLSNPEITLQEFGLLNDITIEIDNLTLFIRLAGPDLSLTISDDQGPTKEVEICILSESLGELKGVTDIKGNCLIRGILPEPIKLKINLLKTGLK